MADYNLPQELRGLPQKFRSPCPGRKHNHRVYHRYRFRCLSSFFTLVQSLLTLFIIFISFCKWDREDEEAHALREVRFDLTRLVNWQKQYFAFMNMVRTNRARIAYGERPFRSVQQVYRCTGEKTREVEGQL